MSNPCILVILDGLGYANGNRKHAVHVFRRKKWRSAVPEALF